jgi:hypothetical protein
MTIERFTVATVLACIATTGAFVACPTSAKALPALGSPAAAKLPELDLRVSIPGGPDTRTLRLDRWVSAFPAESPKNSRTLAAAVAAAKIKLPVWSASVQSFGQTFKFTMLGGTVLGTGAGTKTIDVVVVPLKFKFKNGTLDATDPVAGCSPAGATTMIAQSPLFQPTAFKVGKTNVGTSQFIDLFQRANFWKYVRKNNPNYHLLFNPTQAPTVTVKVNDLVQPIPCNTGASGSFGSVDFNAFDQLVRKTLIPQLSSSINPTVIPIFLSYDVVFGGAAGYHNAFVVNRQVQVYGVSTYMDVFGSTPDALVLSHEMAEFTDDPLTDNPTPPWGHIGQVQLCQDNLEPGDPLTGLNSATVQMPNGFVYTVTDLANFSWFYRQSPSIAVAGRYTMFGFFSSAQSLCQ